MHQGNDLAIIFAYIGGVAGISSIIFNSYKLYLERRKIDVDGGIGSSPVGNTALMINATNFGRRPIWLIGIGIQDKKHFFEKYLPPTKKIRGRWHLYKGKEGFLAEGDFVTAIINDYSDVINGNCKYIFAYDSLGKKWKLKRRRLRRIIKETPLYSEKTIK